VKDRLTRWRERLRQRRTTDLVYRTMVGITGAVVLAGGIIAIPYPGPGWAIVFLGLGILATEFRAAQVVLAHARARYDAAMAWFARSRGRDFLNVMDLIAPCVPTGLASGRLGNFINGELWGRAADPSLPWAMVFPQSGSDLPRHPSPLYQFALEGMLLFVLLWVYAKKPRGAGQVAGAFLFGYGILRFVAEFFREPDDFLGLLALGMSMGQWLCVPMVLLGAGLWWRGRASAPAVSKA